jgi:hypothetical protein
MLGYRTALRRILMGRRKGTESKSPGRPSKYNWDVIRKEYVYGFKKGNKIYHPTYNDLAERWGLSVNSVAKKGSEENWAKQRHDAMKAESRKIMKIRERELIDEALNGEKQEMQIVKLFRSIVYSKLVVRELDEEGNVKVTPNLDMDILELGKLAKIFETMHYIRDNITKTVFLEYDKFVRENEEEEKPKMIIQLPPEFVNKFVPNKRNIEDVEDVEDVGDSAKEFVFDDEEIDEVFDDVVSKRRDELKKLRGHDDDDDDEDDENDI